MVTNPLRIFVSSVQKELTEERRAMKSFIEGDPLLGRFFTVFLFEDLPASEGEGPRSALSSSEETRHKRAKHAIGEFMRLPALAESLWHSHLNRARIAPIAPGIDSQMTYVVHQGEEGEIGT